MKLKFWKQYKVEKVIANMIRILLLLAIVASIITESWLNLATAVLTIFLTYLPFIIAKKNHIYLPPSFQIIILLFIFASLYLGEIHAYYIRFWWWDIMLHAFSGVILGFVGFLLTYYLNEEEKLHVMLSPFFVAFFSFNFAVTVGVIWEIFEFAMDSIFGTNMQASGLVDTMWDLIVDALGALFSSTIGYIYMKNQQKSFYERIVKPFIKKSKAKKESESKSKSLVKQ